MDIFRKQDNIISRGFFFFLPFEEIIKIEKDRENIKIISHSFFSSTQTFSNNSNIALLLLQIFFRDIREGKRNRKKNSSENVTLKKKIA